MSKCDRAVQDGAHMTGTSYADKSPVERFVALASVIGAARADGPDWPAYERLKRDFVRQCPDATQSEYEQAMRAIARAAGV
jgi:hypothetical protein